MSDFYKNLGKDVDESDSSMADLHEVNKKLMDMDSLDAHISNSNKNKTGSNFSYGKVETKPAEEDSDLEDFLEDFLADDSKNAKKNKPATVKSSPTLSTFEGKGIKTSDSFEKAAPSAPKVSIFTTPVKNEPNRGSGSGALFDDDDIPLDFDEKKPSSVMKKSASKDPDIPDKPARSVLESLLYVNSSSTPTENPQRSLPDFDNALKSSLTNDKPSNSSSKMDDFTFGTYRPSSAVASRSSNEEASPQSKRMVHFDNPRPFTASSTERGNKFVSRFEFAEEDKSMESSNKMSLGSRKDFSFDDYLSLGAEVDLDQDDKGDSFSSNKLNNSNNSGGFGRRNSEAVVSPTLSVDKSLQQRRSSLATGNKQQSVEDGNKAARVTFDTSLDIFSTESPSIRPATSPSSMKNDNNDALNRKKRFSPSSTLDSVLQQDRLELRSASPNRETSPVLFGEFESGKSSVLSKPPPMPGRGRSAGGVSAAGTTGTLALDDDSSFLAAVSKQPITHQPASVDVEPDLVVRPSLQHQTSIARETPPLMFAPPPQPQAQALQAHQHQLSTNYMEMENKIRRLEMERDHLQNILDLLKQKQKDELTLLEDSYKQKVQIIEETHQRREQRLREENELLSAHNLERLKLLESERAEVRNEIHRRLELADKEKEREIERLREEHRRSLDQLRRDHSEAIERLRLTRVQEMETLQEAAPATRSLRATLEEMQSSARQLGNWKSNVNMSQSVGLEEREIHMKSTEERLRVWEDRLRQQEDDVSRERIRLQELVAKLESQIRDQVRMQEESRWKVKEEQNRLMVLQTSLEEERRSVLELSTRERANLEKAKEATLSEQKSMLQQLYEERRTMAEERAQFHAQQKQWEERQRSESMKIMNSGAQFSGQQEVLVDEKRRLNELQLTLNEERDRINREKMTLEREKQQLVLERDQFRIETESGQLKNGILENRLRESEKAERNATEKLAYAKTIQEGHEQRLAEIQQNLKLLHDKEKSLAQEKVLLARERDEWRLRKATILCSNCQIPVRDSVDPLLQSGTSDYHSVGNYLGSGGYSVGQSVSSDILPAVRRAQELAVRMEQTNSWQKLKIESEKDDIFLEEERRYLQSLREHNY